MQPGTVNFFHRKCVLISDVRANIEYQIACLHISVLIHHPFISVTHLFFTSCTFSIASLNDLCVVSDFFLVAAQNHFAEFEHNEIAIVRPLKCCTGRMHCVDVSVILIVCPSVGF